MNKDLTPVGKGGSSSEDLKTIRSKKRKKTLFVSILVIVSALIAWHFFRIHQIESLAETEMAEQQLVFSKRLDSLNLDFSQETSVLLSWAVRGEMIRGNKDQVRQYFNEYVKNKGVLSVQLINPENGMVEISTNAKNEGSKNRNYNKITGQVVEVVDSSFLRIATPITSLNKVMNVLLVEVQRNNKIEK